MRLNPLLVFLSTGVCQGERQCEVDCVSEGGLAGQILFLHFFAGIKCVR